MINSLSLDGSDVWRLYHQTLCPFSRTVRLVLGERRLAYELIEVATDDDPCPARTGYRNSLPRLCDPVRDFTLTGSWSICEYLEEATLGPSMLMGSAEQRAEIRRLVAWADDIFYQKVTLPALSARLPGWASRRTRIDGSLGSAQRHADDQTTATLRTD